MKVLMQNRPDAVKNPGGDTIQMFKTKEYLEKLGCEIDISGEFNCGLEPYDLVHLFNITRIHETYLQYLNAKKQNKPIVLSPIYQNFEELDKKAARGLKGHLWKILGKNGREAIKTLVRAVIDPSQVRPALTQLRVGFTRQQKAVLSGAALLLPNSSLEAQAIASDFGLRFDYLAIPNAIDTMFARRDDSFARKTGLKDYVLCVGNYIERKNQVALIKAMRGLGFPLVMVGAVVPTHRHYYAQVVAEAARADFSTKIISKISQAELVSVYWGARVIALPSWIETTGLSCLEGALADCNVVITDRGYTREYFGDLAYYCSPDDLSSIKEAIARAYNAPLQPALKARVQDNFTWEKTAQATLEAYNRALKGR